MKKAGVKVLKLEEILTESTSNSSENGQLANDSSESDDSVDEAEIAKQKPEYPVPFGKPKSKRIWKNRKSRFSSIIKTPGLQSSKEKKDMLRQQLKNVKEHSRALLEERRKEKEEKRKRRQENLKRQEENQRKSEIVQVIKNTAKLKKMKKKQLRKVEKRDTTKLLKQ